jgi:hypothetical protein
MKSALELLEAKSGHVHTTYDFQRAREKAATAPGTLTDVDLAVLSFFGGETKAAEARAAREQVLHPPADPPAPVAAVSSSVEFPDALWDTDAPDQVAEMEQWSVKHAMRVLPLRLWWKFVNAGREKREALAARVDALATRITDLEAREYQGVWKDTTAYAKGAMVTRAGSVWHSNVHENRTKPGEHEHWTLVVKRGSDGKDLR